MRNQRDFVLLGAAATLLLIFGFQNCAPQDLTGGVDPESEEPPVVETTYDTKLDELSFPYEISFSQFAFSSCVNPSSAGPGSFNYLLTSHNVMNNDAVPKAGLKLRSAFRSEFSRYALALPAEKQLPALSDALRFSKNAKGFVPFMTFTPPENGEELLSLDDGRTTIAQHLFREPLSHPEYVDRFVADRGAQTYSFFDAVGAPSLDVTEHAVVQRLKLRLSTGTPNFFSSGDLRLMRLTVAFGNFEEDANRPLIAKPSSARNGRIYGKTFELSYQKPSFQAPPNQTSEVYGYTSVVRSIQEFDASTGAAVEGANWNCPVGLRLKVVREADRMENIYNGPASVKKACPHQPLSGVSAEEDLKTLKIVQRMLPPSHFDVNITDRCVVPREQAQCYNSETDKINYNDQFFTEAEVLAAPVAGAPLKTKGCGINGQFDCPHFVTICYRSDL